MNFRYVALSWVPSAVVAAGVDVVCSAERRAELERQARLAAELKLKLLEDKQVEEVSRRKLAESAVRRQQREHEDTVQKILVSYLTRPPNYLAALW